MTKYYVKWPDGTQIDVTQTVFVQLPDQTKHRRPNGDWEVT